MYNEQDDELTIDLKDLFSYLLRKWEIILCCMLVLAAMVGTYRYVTVSGAQESQYSDETLEAITRDMTNADKQTVTQLYNRYMSFQEKVTNNQYYLQHSILMNMDPNNVSRMTIEYQLESKQPGIVSSFSKLTMGLDEYQKIAPILGTNTDPKYVYEVVNISGTDYSDKYASDESDGTGTLLEMLVGDVYKGIIDINITAGSRQQCDQIAEIAREAVNERLQELTSAGVDLTLKETGTNYNESVDQSLANSQLAAISEGSNLVASYNSFKKDNVDSLSEEMKTYFDFLVNRRNEKKIKVGFKRYTAIGGLAGAMLAIVVLALQYLLSDTFKTADEVAQKLKVTQFGVIHEVTKKRRGLNKLFKGWADDIAYSNLPNIDTQEVINIICFRIAQICREKGVQKVYIADASGSEFAIAKVQQIADQLSKENIEVFKGDVGRATDLKEMTKTQAAVIVNELNNRRRSLSDETIQICEECKTPVIGNIVVSQN